MTRFLVFLCLITVSSLAAEAKDIKVTGDSQYENKITFINEHHLYRGNDGLTIVALDLEWPEVLNHSTSPALQKYLCTTLFDNQESSLTAGMGKFLRSKGNEVSQIPDNPGKVNHISIDLYGIVWEQNKYISYRYSVKERDNASPTDSIKYGFFTYDIMNDRILTTEDIFRARFLPGGFEHERMLDLVLKNMSNDDEFNIDDVPGEAFFIPNGVALAIENVNSPKDELSLVSLPFCLPNYDYEYHYMLIGDARKLLKSKPVARMAPVEKTEVNNSPVPEPGTDPSYIYKVVDEHPSLMNETMSIDTYLAKNAQYPYYETYAGISGKVVLQFVVEIDGSISQISSVRPISPGLAHEAVRVLRDTPKWKPATIKGIPVRSLCNVTINFALKK